MLNIVELYNKQEREREEKRNAIDTKIKEKQAQIKRLEKRRAKLRSESWVKGIVEPLAEALASRTGLSWEIYGPFGLTAETSIYLRKNMSRSICDQTTRSISLIPFHNENGEYIIHYKTEEIDDSYPEGSIGALNGMNRKTALLPDTIEEIEKLLITQEH